jgi:argininosuccinate lyase
MAYFEMFSRDAERLADCRKRVNRLPLGASALAGTSFPIDRESVARELGFDGVCENSLDAVSDRDFAIEFLAGRAIAMMHVSAPSRGAGDLDEPAVRLRRHRRPLLHRLLDHAAEEESGRSGADARQDRAGLRRAHDAAHVMKGQPLAYNKDNQEDKEPLFDAADTLADVFTLLAQLLPAVTPRPERMRAALSEGSPPRPTSPTTW